MATFHARDESFDFKIPESDDNWRHYRHGSPLSEHAAVFFSTVTEADPSTHPVSIGIDCELTGPGHSGRVVSAALVGVNADREIVIVACWNLEPTYPAHKKTIDNFWNRIVPVEMRVWLKGTRAIDRVRAIAEIGEVLSEIKSLNPHVKFISDHLVTDETAFTALMTEIFGAAIHERTIDGNDDAFVTSDDVNMQMRIVASLVAGKVVKDFREVYAVLATIGYKRVRSQEIAPKLRAVIPDLPELLLNDHSAIFDAACSLWRWLSLQDLIGHVKVTAA